MKKSRLLAASNHSGAYGSNCFWSFAANWLRFGSVADAWLLVLDGALEPTGGLDSAPVVDWALALAPDSLRKGTGMQFWHLLSC